MAGARQMPLNGVDPKRTQMGQALCQSPMSWKPTGATDSTGIRCHGAKQTQFLGFWPENARRARERSQSEVARPLRSGLRPAAEMTGGAGRGAWGRLRQTKPIWLAVCPQELILSPAKGHQEQHLTASLRTRDARRRSPRAERAKQSQSADCARRQAGTRRAKQTQSAGRASLQPWTRGAEQTQFQGGPSGVNLSLEKELRADRADRAGVEQSQFSRASARRGPPDAG